MAPKGDLWPPRVRVPARARARARAQVLIFYFGGGVVCQDKGQISGDRELSGMGMHDVKLTANQ